MPKFLVSITFSLLILAFATIHTTAVSADSTCRIGKPSYCAKYGTFRCRAKNIAANPTKACAAWADACRYCHSLVRACLKSETVYSNAKARCRGCSNAWERCMEWVTARHYPNRLYNEDEKCMRDGVRICGGSGRDSAQRSE